LSSIHKQQGQLWPKRTLLGKPPMQSHPFAQLRLIVFEWAVVLRWNKNTVTENNFTEHQARNQGGAGKAKPPLEIFSPPSGKMF